VPAAPASAQPPSGAPTPPATASGSSSTPPTFSVTQLGNIQLGGDTTGGFDATYTPPDCWLQPWYHQPESILTGDPKVVDVPQTADSADSFYWSVLDKYPGLHVAVSHIAGAAQGIDGDFRMVQQGQNDVPGGQNPVTSKWVWWGPNWLQNAAGWACAQALIANTNLNNGFLDLEPPQPPDNGTPNQITSQNLAALARATLQLPNITINTRPAATTQNTSTFVNLPTTVYVTYGAPGPRPSDRASVVFDGGVYLWAQITTSAPQVTIKTSDPGAVITDNGVCSRKQPCSVKFANPNGNAPFTITATATWTVNWATSDGRTGTFTTPPSQVVVTRDIYVREIQAVNN
jgi:hypothetical protein